MGIFYFFKVAGYEQDFILHEGGVRKINQGVE